ncbi:hypothetical protein KC460_00710 [Candidatus Dependentiae bacterium]|nr:hypothetical protein [Candidatus Dependentiae bacterium]
MNFYEKNRYYFYKQYNNNRPRFFWGIMLFFIGASIISRTLLGTSFPVDIAIGGIFLYFGLKMIFGWHHNKFKKYYD